MTATTPRADGWLRSLPPSDAAALVAEIEAAHAALPQLRPGVRVILPGMLWRIETSGYRASFGSIDGTPVIVSGDNRPANPARIKKARAA